jgi:hypothetical protein
MAGERQQTAEVILLCQVREAAEKPTEGRSLHQGRLCVCSVGLGSSREEGSSPELPQESLRQKTWGWGKGTHMPLWTLSNEYGEKWEMRGVGGKGVHWIL